PSRGLRIDLVLAAWLLTLYALVLPLALRTGRLVGDQSVRLEEETRRLSALVDQMPAAVWTTDTDLHLSETAGSGLANIGLGPAEHHGRTLSQIFGTDDPDLPVRSSHR